MKKMTENAMRHAEGGTFVVRYIKNGRWQTWCHTNNRYYADRVINNLLNVYGVAGLYDTNTGEYRIFQW